MSSNSSTPNKHSANPESSSPGVDPSKSTETDSSQAEPIADTPEQAPNRTRLRDNLFKRMTAALVREEAMKKELDTQYEHCLSLYRAVEKAVKEVKYWEDLEKQGIHKYVLLELPGARLRYTLALNAHQHAKNMWESNPKREEHCELIERLNAMAEMWFARGFE